MNEQPEIDKGKAKELYLTLHEHLRRSDEGRQIIAVFEENREEGGEALANYLREQLPEDKELAAQIANVLGDGEQITTIVSGGVVDQIVNIATVGGDLTIDHLDGSLNIRRVDTLRQSIFGSVRQVVTVILSLLAVIALVTGSAWYLRQPRQMPEGDSNFNIAIAQFYKISDDSDNVPSPEGKEISNALSNFIDSEFKEPFAGLNVNVTQKNMPLIEDGTEAEELADRINADMVVFGEVKVNKAYGVTEFWPRFHVTEKPDTDEITGQSELAHPIKFDLPILYENAINRLLRQRAAILILFTQGLVYMSADDHLDEAADAFSRAILEAEAHGKFDGQEVLYLLLGSTYRKQGDYENADKYYNEALDINPDYARAFIGLGNIYYSQYIQDLDDESLAEKALDEYRKALEAEDSPPSAYIAEKVNVNVGNIYSIQSQQTGDPASFEKMIDHYSQVTNSYDHTQNERIRELAAIAHFGLGAAYERKKNIAEAVDAYCSAIQLTEKERLASRAKGQLDILEESCP